jgi:4-amino-4-deoxy-L-arabinose transferase-like glycosyltransferase
MTLETPENQPAEKLPAIPAQPREAAAPREAFRRVRVPRVRAPGTLDIQSLNRMSRSIAVGALLAVIGIGLFGRFYAARFSFLPTISALEQGDIARHLSHKRGFVTGVGHPLGLDHKAGNNTWQDMTYSPVYPLLLAVFFRLRGPGDTSVALLNGFIHLLTGIFVYLIAARLRGPRTAFLATVLYYVSMEPITAALNATGITVATFFTTAGLWLALADDASFVRKMNLGWWAAAIGILFGLAYLCGGLSVLLVVPVAVMLALRTKQASSAKTRPHWVVAGVVIGAFLVTLSLWAARNLMVSGTLSPLTSEYKLLAYTSSYPALTILRKYPGQALDPLTFVFTHPGEMVTKFFGGLTDLYRQVPFFMNVYLFPFALLAGLGLTVPARVKHTWKLLFWLLGLQLITLALYDFNAETLETFMPLGVCLATIVVVGFVRAQLSRPAWQMAAIALLLAVSCFPYGSSLVLGRKASATDTLRDLAPLKAVLADNAIVATNIPAAVTWYTGLPTVPLPEKLEDIGTLAAKGTDPDYVYMSRDLLQRLPGNPKLVDKTSPLYLGQPIRLSDAKDALPIFERRPKHSKNVQLKRG